MDGSKQGMCGHLRLSGGGAAASVAALATCILAMPAAAQAGPAPAPSAPQTSTSTLQEIVVTAQRVEQKLQEVPVSVTAQTGAQLEQKGITNVNTLAVAAPNIAIAASPSGGSAAAQIFIRGVGQIDPIVTLEPDVPVYLDGVYLSRSVGVVTDFVDIARVEVLRGPQGTLFGRNTLGGAVQVITNAPTNRFEGLAQATVGSFNRRDFDLVANVPVTDTLAFRFTGYSHQRDGYGERLPVDLKTGDQNDRDIKGQVRWRPDGATDIIARAEYYDHKTNGALQTLTAVADTPTLDAYNAMLAAQGLPQITNAMVPSDPYKGQSGIPNRDTARAWTLSLDASHQFSFGTVKSITSLRDLRAANAFDFAGVPYPYLFATTLNHNRTFTEELQAFGKAWDDRLSWIVGGYLYRDDADSPNFATLLENVVRTGPGPYDFAPVVGSGVTSSTPIHQLSHSYALYAQADLKIFPRLTLTAGVRESWDRKSFSSSYSVNGFTVRPLEDQTAKFSQFTPKVALNYKLAENSIIYISASKGYRAGGFNGHNSGATLTNSYDPEQLWDYEAGIKYETPNRRLIVNLGGFYYDYKNYQASENEIDSNGLVTVVVGNVARARIYGAELETTAKLLDNLDISAHAALLYPKFLDISASSISVTSSTRPPNAPKFSAGISGDYRFAVGRIQATLHGDWSYRTKSEFFIPNLPGEAQKAYSLVNARLSVPVRDDVDLAVFGTNILDKRYKTYGQSVADSFGTIIGVFAPPAEWGVSLKFKWR